MIDDSYAGVGPKVVILGDSITYQSQRELRSELSDYAVKIAAWTGEGYDGGPFSDQFGAEKLMVETARRYIADPPEVVVVALGTNDAWNPTRSLPGALAGMDDIVEGFTDACLVGVTVPQDAPIEGYSTERGRSLNEAMRRWADVVVLWEPGLNLLRDDGVHPSGEGRRIRARLLADGVAECEGR